MAMCRLRTAGLSFFVVVLALLAIAGPGGSAAPGAGCSRWAAPYGDDGAPGTQARPYLTITKLAASLAPGQTGCVPPGSTFVEHPVVAAVGTAAARITITTAPGTPATLANGLETTQSARYLTLTRLVVRGDKDAEAAKLPATVTLRGFSVAFTRSDVAGGEVGRTCVLLDHAGRALVDRNALHDCGVLADGLYAAGVAVGIATNATIRNNVISGNPGDGISLAPNALRSVVSRNLLVGNDSGVYIGGGPKVTSRDNRVERNIVTESRRFAVHASFAPNAPIGTGNRVTSNCFWAAGQAAVAGTGFRAANNRVVNPRVVEVGGSYAVAKSSPCYAYRPAP